MQPINIALSLVLVPGFILCMLPNANAQERYPGYKADNTVQNMRDRDVDNPTPQDQSNRRSDLKLTARLRRALVAERGLSMDAKNIKIIDRRGYVVLRGPVDNNREKEIIDRLAQQYCGVNYKNELEVKFPR